MEGKKDQEKEEKNEEKVEEEDYEKRKGRRKEEKIKTGVQMLVPDQFTWGGDINHDFPSECPLMQFVLINLSRGKMILSRLL